MVKMEESSHKSLKMKMYRSLRRYNRSASIGLDLHFLSHGKICYFHFQNMAALTILEY